MENPPAFPYAGEHGARIENSEGMTLREWYIGKALQGFCANPAVFAANAQCGWGLVNCTEKQLIEQCALLADEAIAARGAA